MILFNNLYFARKLFSFLNSLSKLVPNRIISICVIIFIWFIFICYICSVLFFFLSLYLLGNWGTTVKISLPCFFCAFLAIIFSLKIFFVKIVENLFIMLLAQLTNCLYKLINFIYFITNHLYVFFLMLGNKTYSFTYLISQLKTLINSMKFTFTVAEGLLIRPNLTKFSHYLSQSSDIS